jgi:aryl-alcohol dehydrogenase-like predicted oxidoreductase
MQYRIFGRRTGPRVSEFAPPRWPNSVLATAREIGATPSQVAVAWLRHRHAA